MYAPPVRDGYACTVTVPLTAYKFGTHAPETHRRLLQKQKQEASPRGGGGGRLAKNRSGFIVNIDSWEARQ